MHQPLVACEMFPVSPEQVTYDNVLLIRRDDLNKLPYLTTCIKESLRFTSPVPVVSRIATRDIMFADGRSVPAGELCSLHKVDGFEFKSLRC